MTKYEGEVTGDSRFSNVQKWGSATEKYLFKPKGKPKMNFGYVHVPRGDRRDKNSKSLRIERLGAKSRDPDIDDVHVIWIASEVGGDRGICVVGDYRDATVYREAVEDADRFYNVVAENKNCTPIPEGARVSLANCPLRRGNVWYAEGSLGEKVTEEALRTLRRFYKRGA
jgi:hypothetical protein